MKRPNDYSDVESIQTLVDEGETDHIIFRSDYFWYGRCMDDGCPNLHVLCRMGNRPYEVAVTFTCEQLDDMLQTARLIRQHHRN